MSQFYHRYRSLFSSEQPQYITDHYRPPTLKPIRYFDSPVQSRLIRSDANDEFKREVLPKLEAGFHESMFSSKRAKTEAKESKSILKRQSPTSNSSTKKRVTFIDEMNSPVADGKLTSSQRKGMKSLNLELQEPMDLNRNIDRLEKQYMKNLVQFKHKPVSITNPETLQPFSSSPFPDRQWRVRLLPQLEIDRRLKEVSSPSHFTPQTTPHIKDGLYLHKSNPYAFINSRIEDIRKSEHYYPRGLMSKYREVIYRRRDCKDNLERRRAELRELLQNDIYH